MPFDLDVKFLLQKKLCVEEQISIAYLLDRK